jgi:hypothetical protein
MVLKQFAPKSYMLRRGTKNQVQRGYFSRSFSTRDRISYLVGHSFGRIDDLTLICCEVSISNHRAITQLYIQSNLLLTLDTSIK